MKTNCHDALPSSWRTRRRLYKLPELHRLRSALLARDLGPLMAEMELRGMSTDQALGCLEQVWLASILETVSLSDRRIGAFDGEAHRRTVAEFREADASHIATAPTRVRRAVAERATRIRDAYPVESGLIEPRPASSESTSRYASYSRPRRMYSERSSRAGR